MLPANELKTIFEKRYDCNAWYNVIKENFNVISSKENKF